LIDERVQGLPCGLIPFFGAGLFLVLTIASLLCASCASNAASAEEYYSIGMAYFELGKYPEAEHWLNRARSADRTMVASEYNLGRIAFETGRYDDALMYFENILVRDAQNVIVLKAAAYTCIRTGAFSKAESYYTRVLALVPESADDGYNYALVLYAVKKYAECETVLLRYPQALNDKPDSLLLLARAQNAADKVEAIDSYAKYIAGTSASPTVFYEYAKALEKAELYARALEQYRESLSALRADQEGLKRSQIRFDIARLLLVADPGNDEGITELNAAITDGFNDTEALELLLADQRIAERSKQELRNIISGLRS
jgi:tetratricopeptide (TPR) repeat protein